MLAVPGLWLWLSAAPAAEPSYAAPRTAAAHDRLMDAEDAAWAAVPRIAWGPARYETAFRALWDDAGLFVRFDARDPAPWHTLTRRDGPLWDEEVVEIFVDPGGSGKDYAEIEISPANVVCDLHITRPWPRVEGNRAWNLAGLESRVRTWTEGPGWTATAWLPWEGFRSLRAGAALPPRVGDAWRFNVFRIERPHGRAQPERDRVLAAWSPTGGPSFHVPSVFRKLVFAPSTEHKP